MTSGAFLFGKLPTHGDFVARGLSSPARDAWDVWLSTAMERDRSRLGEAFEAAHDAGPPWRFVKGPDEGGQSWCAGALAPSVDSVGRRFFIVVGRGALSEATAGTDGEAMAEAMADLIYQAFANGWTADDLAASASAADCSPDAANVAARRRWWCAPSADGDLLVIDGPPQMLVGVETPARVLEAAS